MSDRKSKSVKSSVSSTSLRSESSQPPPPAPPATAIAITTGTESEKNVEGGENVRVVVRCRPLSRKEAERQCKQIVDVDNEVKSIVVHGAASDSEPKNFTFDSVFPPDSTQADVYNDVARPIVENVLVGYNGTIFAYGQTGTGKTYTMEGVHSVPTLKGIIPNSFAQIFAHIAKAEGDQRFLVRCSYLEIYNEDVRDLLAKDTNTKLEVKENKDKGVYVKNLSSFVVRNADDMDRIMGIGNRNRSVASTNMNSVSSRSHAIFTIMVECSMEHKMDENDAGAGEQKGKINGRSFRMGKLNLVDLAGSERLSKTQATGDRLKEATKINLSLSNLGNVISALVDGSSHVPYRNSKLTRLLQDSLGGNSKTVMVANVGPADYNYDETVSTLRFANRAKNIKNHAIINEDPKDAMLRQFEKQIQDLRRQLEEELAAAERGEPLEDHIAIAADGEAEAASDTEADNKEGLDDLEINEDGVPGEEAIIGIKDELENHAKLSSTIGNVSQDRKSVITALQERVMTWKETEAQKAGLQHKLKSLQKKVLVGGENLLDKSQAQEELLLQSMKELSLRKEEEIELQEHLKLQEDDRKTLESRILSMQEQNLNVSKKLKKIWNQYQVQKNELSQIRLECQEETDVLVDEVHKLSRELQYHNLIIDNFIPSIYQSLIEKSVKWHADTGEWTLKCVAYAGNNMTRGDGGNGEESPNHDPINASSNQPATTSVDLSYLYLDISDKYCIQEDVPQVSKSNDAIASTAIPPTEMKQSTSSSSIGGSVGRQRPLSAAKVPSSRPSTSFGGQRDRASIIRSRDEF